MPTPRKRLLALAVSTAAIALAAGALAQNRPSPSQPGAASTAQPLRTTRAHDRQAERIKALHDALNIRADQEPAFKSFTTALAPNRDGAGARQRTAPAAEPTTTPERLDLMQARIQARDQRLAARITAIKTFYAALNTDQKHTFDSLPMLHNASMQRGPADGRGMMRGPGMRGPGGPNMGGPNGLGGPPA